MTHARTAFALSLALATLAGCASMRDDAQGAAPASGDATQATIEGRVVRVDTSPWAYDGHALVVVATADRGEVTVQLPARWNLCKAPAPEGLDTLAAPTRVRATGTVGEANTLTVCERAEHALTRLD